MALDLLLLLGVAIVATVAQESPVVELPGLGTLRGVTTVTRGNRTINSFLGIPYAKPPTGERRFLAPVDVDPWEDVLDVSQEGTGCPQNFMGNAEGDEDCLTLDVYTHELSEDAGYPVLVFIHGGAFMGGNSRMARPEFLMDEDIVLVSIQYRLGLLGFLSLQTDDVPGNAGMLDQVKALQWVQSYIGNFGGLPNRVTIWGQSAGSISVNYHLVSPLSANLFQQAILESGSLLANEAMDRNPVATALEIAESIGCSSANLTAVAACFISTPPEGLVDALSEYQSNQERLGIRPWAGRVVVQTTGDIKFLEEDPEELYTSGNLHKVPMMSGATKNEAVGGFLEYARNYLEPNYFTTDVQVRKDGLVEALLRQNAILDPGHVLVDAIQEKYFGNASMENFADLLPGIIDFMSLTFMRGPTYRAMQINSKYERSYWYAFNYYQPQYSMPNDYNVAGVDHAADLKYLFPTEDLDDEGEQLSLKMTKLFANFAIYGNPTAPDNPVDGVPEWPPYTADDERYLRMDKEFVILDDFKKEFTISSQEGLPQPQG